MEIKDNPIKGGVSIIHKVLQEKHHYEVAHVMKFKKDYKSGPFVRKGDKILKINGQDLEDLTPEAFAELLAEASPMLTVHSPGMDAPEDKCLEGSGLQPFSKEQIILNFSLEMRREEELEEEGGGDDSGTSGREETPGGGDDCLFDDTCSEMDDLLLVSMMRTTISIIRGRGCDAGSPCTDCGGTGCNLNEVVMVAESSKITLVSRGTANFLREKVQENILIQSLMNDMYIQQKRSRSTPAMARQSQSNSTKITIYYYKSDCVDGDFRGAPVVLNFTGTDCFLKCYHQGGRATLTVENCEKQRLKNISNGDKDTWPFVFYMKATRDNIRRFESANCTGWYIHAKNTEVKVDNLTDQDESFLFIIRK
ncbi:interleukin-1 family member A [Megalops cyprinoides]|uniref:interleukin-1 family member A n=1 Tax=Megalops cyprinoides TaxID=118141 RepID=UPI001863E578|nr:interleukin-1 family member A [Megalops cyprinoides]